MALLFSYGTLQEPRVQLSTFGRLLSGNPDVLVGYEPSLVKIDDPQVATAAGRTHYDNVRHTGRADSRVRGTVFEVTGADLTAADAYEADARYRRVEVVLESGKRAWAYMHMP